MTTARDVLDALAEVEAFDEAMPDLVWAIHAYVPTLPANLVGGVVILAANLEAGVTRRIVGEVAAVAGPKNREQRRAAAKGKRPIVVPHRSAGR